MAMRIMENWCRSFFFSSFLDAVRQRGDEKFHLVSGKPDLCRARACRHRQRGGALKAHRFRWKTDDDDKRDAERAEAERLRDEGKLIEHEANPEPSNKD